MKIYSACQMRAAEKFAVEHGIDEFTLMKNAGTAAAEFLSKNLEINGKKLLVLCGKGNNGGDGFIAAKALSDKCSVSVVLCDGTPATETALRAFSQLCGANVRILDSADNIFRETEASDVIIDAIFGIGFKGEPSEKFKKIFSAVNLSAAKKIAFDLPSGCSGSGLAAKESCIHADITLAFGALKPAHILLPAKEFCGRCEVIDIGVPEEFSPLAPNISLTTDELVFSVLKKRPRDCHKGTFGKLLNISGCMNYLGAPVLSSSAAMRCGCGIVTLAAPRSIIPIVMPSCVGAVALPLDETASGAVSHTSLDTILSALEGSSACLIGCGLSLSKDTKNLVKNILRNINIPVIIDADGINAISENINILKECAAPKIITPHLSEMSRLTKTTVEKIKSDRIAAASALAESTGSIVVLKDSSTVIASPTGEVYVNTTGNPALAKGGSGDVLAGIIAGLAAQKTAPLDAAVCGVYLQGSAADKAAARLSEYAALPADLPQELCSIFSERAL